MTRVPQLDDLLQLWEQSRRAGQPVSCEHLCRDHPELLKELNHQVGAILSMDRMLGTFDTGSVSPFATPGERGADGPESGEPAGRLLNQAVGLLHPPLGPGELGVLGRYRILAVLGAGAMGFVFKAHHPVMDRVVALKMISPRIGWKRGAEDRFHREVKAIARLHHPNLVTAFDADQDGAVHFLVMEYVEGIDLARHVAAVGAVPYWIAAEFIRQAATGLAHAHEYGMVHRDLKPSNLILGRNGIVKIIDLGLARLMDSALDAPTLVKIADGGEPDASDRVERSKSSSTPERPHGSTHLRSGESTLQKIQEPRITATHSALGTPAYMAPEQAEAGHSADFRSDIYSLGATLYHLIAGRPPFSEDHLARLLNPADFAPEPLQVAVPDVPLGLSEVVARMMAQRPQDRYPSAAAVAETLARFVRPATLVDDASGTLSDSSPAVPAISGTGATERRKTPWVVAGAAAVAVCCAIVYFGFAYNQFRRPSRDPAIQPNTGVLTGSSALGPRAGVELQPDDASISPRSTQDMQLVMQDQFDETSVWEQDLIRGDAPLAEAPGTYLFPCVAGGVGDFVCEAEASVAEPDHGGWGIGFGLVHKWGWLAAQFGAEGDVEVRFYPQNRSPEQLIPWTTRSLGGDATATRRLRVEVVDREVRLFANDQFIARRVFQEYRPGTIYLVATRKDLDPVVHFSSFRLWRVVSSEETLLARTDQPAYQAEFASPVAEFPANIATEPRGTAGYEPGVMFVEPKEGQAYSLGSFQPDTLKDGHVRVVGRATAGSQAVWSLVCGVDSFNSTWIDIRADAHYRVRHEQRGGSRFITPPSPANPDGWKQHPALQPGPEFNTMDVRVRPNSLTIWLNNQWASDLTDLDFVAGRVELGTRSDS